jgi:hypothetical protein
VVRPGTPRDSRAISSSTWWSRHRPDHETLDISPLRHAPPVDRPVHKADETSTSYNIT